MQPRAGHLGWIQSKTIIRHASPEGLGLGKSEGMRLESHARSGSDRSRSKLFQVLFPSGRSFVPRCRQSPATTPDLIPPTPDLLPPSPVLVKPNRRLVKPAPVLVKRNPGLIPPTSRLVKPGPGLIPSIPASVPGKSGPVSFSWRHFSAENPPLPANSKAFAQLRNALPQSAIRNSQSAIHLAFNH